MSFSEKNTFEDQCWIVCLHYLKQLIEQKDKNDKVIKDIHEAINQQATLSESLMEDLHLASQSLVAIASQFGDESLEKVGAAVGHLSHGVLDEDAFKDESTTFFKSPELQSWHDVALFLHFTHELLRAHDYSKLWEIAGFASRYLTSNAQGLIETKKGWKLQEENEMNCSGISASIVMVDQLQKITEQAALESNEFKETTLQTPPESPPFSILAANNDDGDSLNSATPPELIERPPMTSSLMQMMGGGDVGENNGASSDSSGFEMVSAAAQKKSQLNTMTSPTDDDELNQNRYEESSSPLVETVGQEVAAKPVQDGSDFSQYIPHISVGVAAAAACIGFFVLKKST